MEKNISLYVTDAMIGHKLGEFAPTRTYYGHAADKKIKETIREIQYAIQSSPANGKHFFSKARLVADMIRGKHA